MYRTNRSLNHHLEQAHRGMKQRYRPTLGLKTMAMAVRFCRFFDEIRAFLRPQAGIINASHSTAAASIRTGLYS
jgi:hypothetical protein